MIGGSSRPLSLFVTPCGVTILLQNEHVYYSAEGVPGRLYTNLTHQVGMIIPRKKVRNIIVKQEITQMRVMWTLEIIGCMGALINLM